MTDIWSLDMYDKIYLVPLYTWILNMPEISRTQFSPEDIDVEISEIKDGIYRISGLVDMYGITFNQFLIDDERPMLIHTGPIGMYKKIEAKVKEVIPLQKLAYVSFLHFESDEWGGNVGSHYGHNNLHGSVIIRSWEERHWWCACGHCYIW